MKAARVREWSASQRPATPGLGSAQRVAAVVSSASGLELLVRAARLPLSAGASRAACPIHEAGSRSRSSDLLLLSCLNHTSLERGLPGRSACTRQLASSVCHPPLPCCFTPFRRANRSQKLFLRRGRE